MYLLRSSTKNPNKNFSVHAALLFRASPTTPSPRIASHIAVGMGALIAAASSLGIQMRRTANSAQ
jgi:hypothetical protein